MDCFFNQRESIIIQTKIIAIPTINAVDALKIFSIINKTKATAITIRNKWWIITEHGYNDYPATMPETQLNDSSS